MYLTLFGPAIEEIKKFLFIMVCKQRPEGGKLGNRVLVIKHDRETGKTTATRTNWSTSVSNGTGQ